MSVAELIGTVIAAAGLFGGLAAWAMKTTVAPLKVVIENNTRVIERIDARLEKHECQLDDHEVRIVKVETVHEIEARE